MRNAINDVIVAGYCIEQDIYDAIAALPMDNLPTVGQLEVVIYKDHKKRLYERKNETPHKGYDTNKISITR